MRITYLHGTRGTRLIARHLAQHHDQLTPSFQVLTPLRNSLCSWPIHQPYFFLFQPTKCHTLHGPCTAAIPVASFQRSRTTQTHQGSHASVGCHTDRPVYDTRIQLCSTGKVPARVQAMCAGVPDLLTVRCAQSSGLREKGASAMAESRSSDEGTPASGVHGGWRQHGIVGRHRIAYLGLCRAALRGMRATNLGRLCEAHVFAEFSKDHGGAA
jgi:hypothetical protein